MESKDSYLLHKTFAVYHQLFDYTDTHPQLQTYYKTIILKHQILGVGVNSPKELMFAERIGLNVNMTD